MLQLFETSRAINAFVRVLVVWEVDVFASPLKQAGSSHIRHTSEQVYGSHADNAPIEIDG